MKEQKKVLLLSVLVAVFLTAFVVSSAMFYFLYSNKGVSSVDQNKRLKQELFVTEELDKSDYLERNLKTELAEENVVENKEVDAGAPAFIFKGAVDWKKPEKVENLGYLKGLAVGECEKVSADVEYYSVGKVKSGTYKDWNLYSVRMPSCGMGVYYNFFKILVNGDEVVFLKGYERFEDYEFNLLKKAIIGGESQNRIINGNIAIEDLNFPDELSFNSGEIALNKKGFEDSFFTNQSYNILKKAFVSEYGQVWVTDRAKAENLYSNKKDKTEEDRKNYAIFDTDAFYIKSPDGNVVLYKINFDSIAHSNEKSNNVAMLLATWNDGVRNNANYELYPLGCGSTKYSYDFSGTYLDVRNDLQIIGKADNEDPIYGFKDTSHPEFKNLYKDIYYERSGEKKSEEEFLKTHPQVFWVDPFGRLLSFYSTDIISPAECGKPVIYLYPEEEMDVHVQVSPGNGFTITDPDYGENGWFVKASPNGDLMNYVDGEKYPYLFWEGHGDELYFKPQKGFVVSPDDLDNFFDDKLSELGLNEQEIFDFKEFWVSKMKEENKNYYFITFLSEGFINKLAPLKVEPKPDSVIRILMDYEGLDDYKEVEQQKFITPKRDGFTVVEWGGMLH